MEFNKVLQETGAPFLFWEAEHELSGEMRVRDTGRLVWKLLNAVRMNRWNQTYAHFPNTVSRHLSLTAPREQVVGYGDGEFCAESELMPGESAWG